MKRALTATELAALKNQGHRAKLWLAIHRPNVVAVLRQNDYEDMDTYEYPFAVISGDTSLIKPGMTVKLGASAGTSRYGISYVRRYTHPETNIYLGENSVGGSPDNDTFLTIYDEYRLWARYPRFADNVWYKDFDVAYDLSGTYTGQTRLLNPVAVMGPPACAFIDPATGVATVKFFGNRSYTLASNSTGLGDIAVLGADDPTAAGKCVWSFPGGSPGSATNLGSAASPITVTWPAAGVYMCALTVYNDKPTGAGKSHTTYRPVFIFERSGANAPLDDFELSELEGDFESGGWTARLRIYGTADVSVVPDDAMIVVFAEESYGDIDTGVNLVPNPSFEIDTNNWTNYNGATFTRDNRDGAVRYGSYAGKVVGTGGQAIGCTFAGLTPGDSYVLSLCGFTTDDSWPAPYIGDSAFGVDAELAWSASTVIPGGAQRTGWCTAVVPADGVLRIILPGTASGCWYDGVQFERRSSPSAYMDGDQAGCSWVGAAHASISRRPNTTTNLFTNPSFETNTTGAVANGAGTTLARDNTKQRFGSYSLKVTPDASAQAGVLFSLGSLTIYTAYAAGFEFCGAAGVVYKVQLANASYTLVGSPLLVTGDGQWHRYELAYTTASAGAHYLYVIKNNSASVAPFWVDGVQLEAKSYATAYCDGDQGACYWTGTAHASTSVRIDPKLSIGEYAYRENIKFVGWVMGETVEWGFDAARGERFVEFEAATIDGRLKAIEGWPNTIEDVATLTSVTKWYQMFRCQVDRAAFHHIKWHSTLMDMCDVEIAQENTNIAGQDFPEGSLYRQLDAYCSQTVDGRLLSTKQSRLYLERNIQTAPDSWASYFHTVFQITRPWHLRDAITIPRALLRRVRQLILEGVYWIRDTGFAGVMIVKSPSTPHQEGVTEIRRGYAFDYDVNWADASQLVQYMRHDLNNPWKDIRLRFAGNFSWLDIAPQCWLVIGMQAADTPRGITWLDSVVTGDGTYTGKRIVVRHVSMRWDPAAGCFEVDATVDAERSSTGDTLDLGA